MKNKWKRFKKWLFKTNRHPISPYEATCNDVIEWASKNDINLDGLDPLDVIEAYTGAEETFNKARGRSKQARCCMIKDLRLAQLEGVDIKLKSYFGSGEID